MHTVETSHGSEDIVSRIAIPEEIDPPKNKEVFHVRIKNK